MSEGALPDPRSALALLTLLTLLGVGSCGDGNSYVLLTVSSGAALHADRLEVVLENAGMSAHVDVTQGGAFDLPPDRTFALRIDPARTGEVKVSVEAVAGSTSLAQGTGQVTIDPGHTVPLSITLLPAGASIDMLVPGPDGAAADLAVGDLSGADSGGLVIDFSGPASVDLPLVRDLLPPPVDMMARAISFSAGVTYSSGPANGSNTQAVAAGDLNGDGKIDVVSTSGSSNLVTTWLNDGTGKFVIGTQIQAGNHGAVFVGQMGPDNKADIVALEASNNRVSVFLGGGDGKTWQAPVNYNVNGMVPGWMEAGDVDGDGWIDVVVSNSASNNISLLLSNKMGAFNQPSVLPAGGTPYAVALGDFNGDQRVDAITGNASTQRLTIFDNTGNGVLAMGRALLLGGLPTHSAVGDFTSDGKPDLVTVRSDDSITTTFGDGAGGMQGNVTFSLTMGSNPRYVVARDFNLDGKLDLAVSLYGANAVALFVGNGKGGFGAPLLLPTAGPLYLAAADFNGDGLTDLVVGNTSTNVCSVFLNTTK